MLCGFYVHFMANYIYILLKSENLSVIAWIKIWVIFHINTLGEIKHCGCFHCDLSVPEIQEIYFLLSKVLYYICSLAHLRSLFQWIWRSGCCHTIQKFSYMCISCQWKLERNLHFKIVCIMRNWKESTDLWLKAELKYRLLPLCNLLFLAVDYTCTL